MSPDKLFTSTISYLKLVTAFAGVMCFVLIFYQSFDPMGGLEMMIVNDLYQTDTLPESARPMYRFVFLLFDWLSVMALAAQYLVIHFALEKSKNGRTGTCGSSASAGRWARGRSRCIAMRRRISFRWA